MVILLVHQSRHHERQTGVRRPEMALTSKDGQKVNVENYKSVALTMTVGKKPQIRYKEVSCGDRRSKCGPQEQQTQCQTVLIHLLLSR